MDVKKNRRTQSSGKTLTLFIALILCIISGGCKSDPQKEQEQIPSDFISQVVNHEVLQQYFHPEIEGRKPLIIADHLVDSSTTLVKFGVPVKFLPKTELQADAYIEFTQFTRNNSKAILEMKYAVEGLICSFDFTKNRDGNWKIKNAQIFEQ